MNMLETLLALTAGLACAAGLALCCRDMQARTQALREAACLQEAARTALAHAETLSASAPDEISQSAPDIDPAALGLAPPEGRSLHIRLLRPAGGAAPSQALPGTAGGLGLRRLLVWLEGADQALASRAARVLPRGWHAGPQGQIVRRGAGEGTSASLPQEAASSAGWPELPAGAFGTELLLARAPAGQLLAESLAARKDASGAADFVRRTWSPPSPDGLQDAQTDGDAGAASAGGTGLPVLRQPLAMQGHALLGAASIGLARLGDGEAAPPEGGAPETAASESGTSGSGTGSGGAGSGAGQAARLQEAASGGIDAVERACLEGGLEGALARGSDRLHLCRQRRLLPLAHVEDAPSVAGLSAFEAGEAPPGEPASCPAGRTPAVFYVPLAAEISTSHAQINLGTVRVFKAAFQGPRDQSFRWLAVQACL